MVSSAFRSSIIAGVVFLGACGESPVQVEQVTEGRLIPVLLGAIASDPSAVLSGVVVSVSGPGIPADLVFSLGTPNSAGQALKSYEIPAGPDRVFIARAFGGGVQTHESDPVTADVTREGVAIDLTLKKLLGSGGINTTVEDFDVTVDDADPFVAGTATTTAAKGATVPFTVLVSHSFGVRKGEPVAGISVTWASENPGIVQVASGSCTTAANGTCSLTATVPQSAKKGASAGVVASYAGIAHRVQVTIE
jgi:hypothetical protein